MIGGHRRGALELRQRLLRLIRLLVADAEVHADGGVVADGERSLEVLRSLRELRCLHVHIAELHERVGIVRIFRHGRFERRQLLHHRAHRISGRGRGGGCFRRGCFGGDRRAGQFRLRDLRSDHETAEGEPEEKTAGGEDDRFSFNCERDIVNDRMRQSRLPGVLPELTSDPSV